MSEALHPSRWRPAPPRPARPSLPRRLPRAPPRTPSGPGLIQVSSRELRVLSLSRARTMPRMAEVLLRGVWSGLDGGTGWPVQVCPASITKRVSLLHPYLKDFLGSPGSGNKTYLFSLILKSPALSLRFCHFLLPSAPTARNSCFLSIPLLCLPATALDF